MEKYINNVVTAAGDTVAGASIRVTTPAGALAVIYDTDGGAAITNPLTSGSNGYFSFYAADGQYTLTISGPGITTFSITDIRLLDTLVITQNVAIASAAATTATNQAANASTSATTSTNQSTNATASALQASLSASSANTSAGVSVGASNLKVDDAAGLAATAEGGYYSIPSGLADEVAIIKRKVGGAAVDTGKRTPAAGVVLLKAQAAFGKNLFNIAAVDVSLGFFPLDTTGALQANAGFNTTGFIPVIAGLPYSLSTKHYQVWFNAARAYISGSSDTNVGLTSTAPAGAAFMRCSAAVGANWNNLQVEQATARTPFELYGLYIAPSQYKDGDISGLKLADASLAPLKTSFLKNGRNLFNKTTRTTGAFMGPDGVATSNASFDHSDFIPVVPGTAYISSGTTMRFVTYFGAAKGVVAGGSSVDTSTFTPPAGVVFVRVSYATSAVNNFQVEAGASATAYQVYGFVLSMVSGEPVTAIPGDSTVGTASLVDQGVTPTKVNFLKFGRNLFNKSAVLAGSFMGPDGVIVSNATFAVSDFIPVVAGSTYTGKGTGTGTGSAMRFTTYFNASKGIVAGGSSTDVTTFTVPAGVAFVRVTVYTAMLSVFQFELGTAPTQYVPFGYTLKMDSGEVITLDPSLTPSWNGKAWAQLGDSITAQAMWQAAVVSKLSLVSTNFGVSGTKISGADVNAMCNDARINAIPTTVDLVSVMGGTNDWAQNTALGLVDSVDVTTFNGALNVMVNKLSTRFPAKRIALFTTPYGELYTLPTGWPNAATNTQGLTTRDYAEAIRIQGKRWGVPVVDISGSAGWNTINIRTYITDDGGLLHPNAVGGGRIAEVVVGAFLQFAPLA